MEIKAKTLENFRENNGRTAYISNECLEIKTSEKW